MSPRFVQTGIEVRHAPTFARMAERRACRPSRCRRSKGARRPLPRCRLRTPGPIRARNRAAAAADGWRYCGCRIGPFGPGAPYRFRWRTTGNGYCRTEFEPVGSIGLRRTRGRGGQAALDPGSVALISQRPTLLPRWLDLDPPPAVGAAVQDPERRAVRHRHDALAGGGGWLRSQRQEGVRRSCVGDVMQPGIGRTLLRHGRDRNGAQQQPDGFGQEALKVTGHIPRA